MCGGNNVTTSLGYVAILDDTFGLPPGSGVYNSNGPHSGTYVELDLPSDGEYRAIFWDATYGCKKVLSYEFVLGTGGCTIPYAANYNSNATFSLNSTCTCPSWTPTVVVNSNATNSNGDGSSFTVTWNMPSGWVNGFNYIIYHAATNTPAAAANIPSGSSDIASKTFTNFEPGSYYVQTQISGLGGEENCYSNSADITISETSAVAGCMDSNADNYNPNATISDGSCTYCAEFAAVVYSTTNPTDGCNGSVSASGTGGSSNYDVNVYDENGIPVNPFALCTGTFDVVITDAVYGCSDTVSITLT